METKLIEEKNKLIETGYHVVCERAGDIVFLERVLKRFTVDKNEDFYTLAVEVVLSFDNKEAFRETVSVSVIKNNTDTLAIMKVPGVSIVKAESIANEFQMFVQRTFLDGKEVVEEKLNRDNWIRVKDKCPECSCTVMTHGTGVHSNGMGSYNPKTKRWHMFGKEIDGVTHWHRFPSAPDESFA